MKKFFHSFCALVLIMGLLSGGAQAAVPQTRFTDLNKSKQQEAVTLMADMGIVEGRGDGSFDPAGTVDRATMSKLIYGILMGDVNPSSFNLVKTDLRDIEGHWAEDYIKYCYDVGIISGTGAGSFDPDGVVNVASAAKMLLVALGYDPTERGYTSNPFWSDNIMADARRAGLMEGIEQFSFEPLNRDNGARMVYNALFSQIYVPQYGIRDGINMIVNYQLKSTTLGLESFGLARMTVNVRGVTPDLGAPMVDYGGIFPKAKRLNDQGEILERIRTEFSFTPEMAGHTAVVYVKASWILDEENGAIEHLTLEELYSEELFLQT